MGPAAELTLSPYLVDRDEPDRPSPPTARRRTLSVAASIAVGVVTLVALAAPRGPAVAPEPWPVTLGRFDAAMFQAGRATVDPCKAKRKIVASWQGHLLRAQPTGAAKQVVRQAVAEFAAADEACRQSGVGHTRYSASVMAQHDSEAFRLLTSVGSSS